MVNTTFLLSGVGNATALAVGAWLHLNGSITIGTVYLIFHYTTMLDRPIQVFIGQLDLLQRAGGSIYRIFELTQTKSGIVDGKGVALPSGPLSVAFDDVSFAYSGNEPLLNGFSFNLEPGRTLGLLGRTGSGKTTLARLLMRLYDVEGGAVRLSGVDVRDTHLDDLRRGVGMVSQNVQLFHGSVRDNLTFFEPSIPDEAILGVIEELGLTSWMASLSNGLDTTLESGGGGLSAGEAQLLAFTRVFLRDPGLVILDEASSRLDRSTESLVQNAIQRLLEGRTVIVIAHHLVTIERVDEIMILQRGQIVEQGERAALASDEGSRFHGLLQTGLEEVLA